MTQLSLLEEELLAAAVQDFPVLYDKNHEGYKETDVVANTWVKVAERLKFIKNGPRAEAAFYALKKKYLRKRMELKNAKRFCKPADVVNKAEKAFFAYIFFSWIDIYTQVRERRRSLRQRPALKEIDRDRKPVVERTMLPNDCEDDSMAKKRESAMPKTARRKRPRMRQSSLEAYVDEVRFPPTVRVSDMTEIKGAPENVDGADELFCKMLTCELKELPAMAKCMAKNDIRNVIFKYQMSILSKGSDNYVHVPLNHQENTNTRPKGQTRLRSDISPPVSLTLSTPATMSTSVSRSTSKHGTA